MRESTDKRFKRVVTTTFLGASFVISAFAVSFTDSVNHWGSSFVLDAASGGYVSGYEDGTFKPNEKVTGNEFAVMITMAFLGDSLSEETKENATKWADPYVDAFLLLSEDSAFLEELMSEVDFDAPLTRFTAAHMVAGILEAQNVNQHSEKQVLEAISSIKDVKGSNGEQQVGTVLHYELMKGMPDGSFHGSDTLTRAEAAVILSSMTSSGILTTTSQEPPSQTQADPPPPTVVVETVEIENNNTSVMLSLTVTLIASIAYSLWLRNTYIKEIDGLKQKTELIKERYFQQKEKTEILGKELALSQRKNRELQEEIEQIRILLSHELQMPTSVIRGYSDLLLEDLQEEAFDTQAKRDYLLKITDRANYISKALYAQLALLTRQTYQLSCVPLDLERVAQQVAEDTTQSAQARGITLQVLPWDPSEPVLADEDLLQNILYNLIENSIKYMGREGMITLRFETKGDCVHLCVRDDGLGLDASETSHIFELNYQGSNRIAGKGFGHGLHMVQQTVLKMNGSIWAESQPGQGMAITLSLPLAKKPVLTLEEKVPAQIN